MLAALEGNGDLYDELPMLYSAWNALDGGLDSLDSLRIHDKGYYEGMEETVKRTARQLLGLEP